MKTKSSDADTLVSTLRTIVQNFCEARDWDGAHTPKDLAIGLVTEASELLELFRFQPEAELPRLINDPGVRAAVADELADSLYCVLRFAQLYEFDLTRALAAKLRKTALKYPSGPAPRATARSPRRSRRSKKD